MNLRDKIKAASDRPTKPIPVPEWDCSVNIRTWSGVERARFFKWIKANENTAEWDHLYAWVAVWSCTMRLVPHSLRQRTCPG